MDKMEVLRMQDGESEVQQYRNQIEAMIDQTSLCEFLETVADVCYIKADHIYSNWQDEALAMYWKKVSMLIDHAAIKAERIFKGGK